MPPGSNPNAPHPIAHRSRAPSRNRPLKRAGFLAVVIAMALALLPAMAGAQAETPSILETAPVVVDGEVLFRVRGVSAYPARARASLIRSRIVSLARDEHFQAEALSIVSRPDRTEVRGGDLSVVTLVQADADLEGLERNLLAEVYRDRMAQAIDDYRRDRSVNALVRNTGYAFAATLIFAVLWWVLLRLFRWLDVVAGRKLQRNLQALASRSHHVIHAGHLWGLVAAILKGVRFLAFALLLYFYLNTVLGLYPWTKPAALALFGLVLDPIRSLWEGFVGAIPKLAFLTILFFITRYLIRMLRGFFDRVENGSIRLQNFDADWAKPTYRILRLLVIAFALVVAYPYIPGSDSLAFKGISLFLGVIFSLGSSSFVANFIAGMTMTYRGAFKEGDVVRIGEVFGRVADIKSMITRIHTLKNEVVIVPNSNILNSNIVNYSALAGENGLAVHVVVGIGYDTPWRQVEALLLEAAARTPGLVAEPAPFVLQTALGDFAVTYELYAWTDDASRLIRLRSELHARIQDAFNEYGVQIMSPAYESDPATAKIVPPERWHEAPARPAAPVESPAEKPDGP